MPVDENIYCVRISTPLSRIMYIINKCKMNLTPNRILIVSTASDCMTGAVHNNKVYASDVVQGFDQRKRSSARMGASASSSERSERSARFDEKNLKYFEKNSCTYGIEKCRNN